MALAKAIELPTGLSASSAYVKIKEARAWKASDGQGYVMVVVEVWKDAEAKTAGKAKLVVPGYDQFKFAVDVSANVGAVSLMGLAYGMLKSLPAFERAQDV